METPRDIHWHEGLFLQPQHFQLWQRELSKVTSLERSWARRWAYGLVKVDFNTEALGQWRLQLNELQAVMPSGRIIHWPANADLTTLDLKPLFTADVDHVTIYLASPLYLPKRRNFLNTKDQQSGMRVLYRAEEESVPDENSGEHERSVMTRRFNAWLLPESADRANLEAIPVLRLVRSLSEDDALPKIDNRFMGPLFAYGASSYLRESITQLATTVANVREQTAIQLQRMGFKIGDMRGTQIEQFFRFRQLNRLHTLLPLQQAQSTAMPPHELYAILSDIAAEFSAGYPERLEDFSIPPYEHDSPSQTFPPLFRILFDLVQGSAESAFIRIPFERRDGGWFAKLEAEHFSRPNGYYLGIRTREDVGQLTELVQDRDRFKLMARTLADRAIFGVRLEPSPVPPMQLPAQSGLHFFRLDLAESPRMWERIEQEEEMVLLWNEWNLADYEIALYMTLPS